MLAHDLNYFQIDCKRKHEQMAFLQSLRTTPDDRLIIMIEDTAKPWELITAPDRRYQRRQVVDGRTNWMINQHLMTLSRNCP